MSRFLFQIVFLFLISLSCTYQRPQNTDETRLAMDTFVTISVYDEDKSEKEIQTAIAAAFDSIFAIETLTSNYIDSSEISRLNRMRAFDEFEISKPVEEIIQTAIEIGALTSGALDITILPVLKLWNFDADSPFVPEHSMIETQLKKVNYKNIRLHSSRLQFLEQGMEIDVGSVAKGYAVDRAVETLISMGMREVMVNAGGDLRSISGPVTRGRRRVWIQHPRDRSKMWGYFPLDTGSVATSGDYERFFMQDGERYHHILDPKSGYPARRCISATVTAKSAMEADALATAIFVLGPEKGLQLAEQIENIDAIIIFEDDNQIAYVVSSGLKNRFKIDDGLNELK
ncbi:FAD:protein FMN transferase [candidate division KSB1 bacterium]|nr:FAD:protein FMN transferase [candidate division KSB1 bacterium]